MMTAVVAHYEGTTNNKETKQARWATIGQR